MGSKIGDLFVRLGLKKADYDRGMRDAEGQARTFVKTLQNLSGIAKAAWAAVAAAVIKFGTDAVQMTQKWGDQWNVTMSGIKAAYGTFVRQLSSGEGWDNLFSNMREAARQARETAAALDEIFERNISYGYEAARIEKEIAETQLIMRDSSKTDKEREDAAKRIIELEAKLGAKKKEILQDEAAALRQNFKTQTQMNDDEIDYLVVNYNKNRDIINQSRKYLEDRARLEKAAQRAEAAAMSSDADGVASDRLDAMAAAARQRVLDLDAVTNQVTKDVAKMVQSYDKGNDELVKSMAAAEVAVINVDTEIARASARATATLGTLTRNSGGSSAPAEDTARRQAEAILKRAEDSAKSEVQLLTEKYNAEKALLEQYGLDTEALWQEYISKMFDIINEGTEEGVAALEEIPPAEIDPVLLDDTGLEEFAKKLKAQFDAMEDLARKFNEAVVSGISDGCQEIMDQLMGVSEMNAGEIFKALLGPLADLAIKQGEILMAEGLGVEACKKALESLNGAAAIAAGGLLIAIGTAAKSGLSALAKNGGQTTSASAYAGGSGALSGLQSIETELTINVEGRVSGSDIVLSGQRTLNNWNR